METERITLRLPKSLVQHMDLILETGEFMTRSELIRHAIGDYINQRSERLIEKAEKLKQVQEINATNAEALAYLQK